MSRGRYAPSMSMVCTSLIQCRQEGPSKMKKLKTKYSYSIYQSSKPTITLMIAKNGLCKRVEGAIARKKEERGKQAD